MRLAVCLAALVAAALPASAAPGASPYELTFSLERNTKRTLFLADEQAAAAGMLPVLRICYQAASSSPSAEYMSVHLGERRQLLRRGECSFFTGGHVEAAVWKGDGSLRASMTLLR